MAKIEQILIIGSGPAGFSAATYAARAQLQPLLIAGDKAGGQLMLTTQVENYPGFEEGILGPDLMLKMRMQAEKFGTRIIDANVTQVDFSQRPFQVSTSQETYFAEAVIVTTGAEAMTLRAPGEMDYTGRGVSYCAVCDAPFFKGKGVVVVGGGDAALEDVLALTKHAREVVIVHRRDSFRASKIMQDRVLKEHKDKVKVMWNSEVLEVVGDKQHVTSLKVKNVNTGEIQEIPADGLFVAVGHKPTTSFLHGQVEFDEKGYVKTGVTYPVNDHGSSVFTTGFPTMTNVPGVFAAGDNVDFRYRQAGTAAGLGIMAALDAQWWLENAKH